MRDQANFAIYYQDSSYSITQKIMGRQSAGKAFMRGIARAWQGEIIHGVGSGMHNAKKMQHHLQQDGFRGQLRWTEVPAWDDLREIGCLYYPSPSAKNIAHSRNLRNPSNFSLMGVTFTLSSAGAMEQVAELVLPPFKPWDAMICISQAAKDFATQIQAEYQDWFAGQTGATRFNTPQMPVIPLGIDCPSFTPEAGQRDAARQALAIAAKETLFLFAGRLSFHAKANPAPVYQALEQVAQKTPIVCIEAGVFPNEGIRDGFRRAQTLLAPSVRFIWVDGQDENAYRQAWKAADVFVSLSDNIQETFGLTPVEAMAAGLPVVVSDWNGYKDTIRDGVDGFRIPTILPPSETGRDLAERHALSLDSYDLFIGRVSLATVVDPVALQRAFLTLATQPQLRAEMGAAGSRRAHDVFDWPVVLQQYCQLAQELECIRLGAPAQAQLAEPWVVHADPFKRFAHFPTSTLAGGALVQAQENAPARMKDLFGLAMTNFGFDNVQLPMVQVEAILLCAMKQVQTANALLAQSGCATPVGVRALMWLWKFDLVRITT